MRLLLLGFFLVLGFYSSAQQRPNIIYIMSDDHDADAISAYNKNFISTPNMDRIANEGIKFNRAFVGNSICSPARATLLTGQHSHKNGVKDNRTPFDPNRESLPKIMSRSGYQTAVVGKWHLHSYPSGFDYWKVFPGQGSYYNPTMVGMKGDTVVHKGYASDVVTNEALSWISNRDMSKPFMLLLHHKAPHRDWFPQLKYLEKFSKIKFPEPSTLYNDSTGRGKAWAIQTMTIIRDMILVNDLKVDPAYLMDIPHLRPDSNAIRHYNWIINRIPEPDRSRIREIYAERGRILQQLKPTGDELLKYKYQWYMQDYMACIASVDESIGKVLDYLDSTKLAENTVVIYTSDQGFYLGENGWFDKRFMYDVSMQTPLLMRWPGKIKAGTVSNALVQNIDNAPTILDIAGVEIPSFMQGISMMPVATGKKEVLDRDALYYHYYEYGRDHTVIPHLGIREERYKLIYFYTVEEWELYDLKEDPAEQKNLINDPAQRENIKRMIKRLIELRVKYDDLEPAGEL